MGNTCHYYVNKYYLNDGHDKIKNVKKKIIMMFNGY